MYSINYAFIVVDEYGILQELNKNALIITTLLVLIED
ncbi:type V toxin-antitoxin system endoribonuclease antitoxin GhoS [Escherichia coli]